MCRPASGELVKKDAMLKSTGTINNCEHFIMYDAAEIKRIKVAVFKRDLFQDREINNHPLGVVYKNLKVADSPLRFVVQGNGTVLVFNEHEWHNEHNALSQWCEAAKRESRIARINQNIDQALLIIKNIVYLALKFSPERYVTPKKSQRFKLI